MVASQEQPSSCVPVAGVYLKIWIRDFDQFEIDSYEAASRDACASFLFVGSSASPVPLQAGATAVPGPEAYSQRSSPSVTPFRRGGLQAQVSADFRDVEHNPVGITQQNLLGTASQHACTSTSLSLEWHAV